MPGLSRTPLRSTWPVQASGTRATPQVRPLGFVGRSMTKSGSERGERSAEDLRPARRSHTAVRVRVGEGVSSGPDVQISVVLKSWCLTPKNKSRGLPISACPVLLIGHIRFLWNTRLLLCGQ